MMMKYFPILPANFNKTSPFNEVNKMPNLAFWETYNTFEYDIRKSYIVLSYIKIGFLLKIFYIAFTVLLQNHEENIII